MPTPEQILAGLMAIANEWWGLAVLWHIYLLVLALALWRGLLSARAFATLLTLPVFSVSILAWSAGNPFNGATLLLGGNALAAIALRLPRAFISAASGWPVIAGAALLMFGWTYPHFLETSSVLAYLYAAPTGLLPCPTLSAVVGLTLAAGGMSRAWSLVLAGVAAFYGIFGAFVLGVRIDLVLTGGAALLFLLAWQQMRTQGHRASAQDS